MSTLLFPLRKMNSHILTFSAFIATCSFLTANLKSQDKPPSFYVTVAQDSFVIAGYQVSMKSGDEWKPVGNFVCPTVTMLQKYRHDVRDHFGFDEEKLRFFDVVREVSSTVSSVCVGDSKIWFGFGFYEGEGWEGYGGVGFFDLTTNRFGVLRHPALIDYSVESLMITDTMIYIKTAGHYELSSSVGNGLVMLNRKTLLVRAIVPPGTPTLWDKDDPVNVGALYNRSISEILSDPQFLNKPAPQFPPATLEYCRSVGLDSFMVETQQHERAMRDAANIQARTVIDTTLTLNQISRLWAIGYGIDSGVLVELWDGPTVTVSIYPHRYYLYPNVTDRMIVEHEEAKFSFTIRLLYFSPPQDTLKVGSVTLHLTGREIR
jgi:hypothetical protein